MAPGGFILEPIRHARIPVSSRPPPLAPSPASAAPCFFVDSTSGSGFCISLSLSALPVCCVMLLAVFQDCQDFRLRIPFGPHYHDYGRGGRAAVEGCVMPVLGCAASSGLAGTVQGMCFGIFVAWATWT